MVGKNHVVLGKMVDQYRADGVAHHVDRGAESIPGLDLRNIVIFMG